MRGAKEAQDSVAGRMFTDRVLKPLLSLFADVSVGVVVVERGGLVTFINRAAGALLSIRPDYAAGKHIEQVFPDSRIREVFQTGKFKDGLGYLLGTRRVKSTVVPFRWRGQVAAAVELMLDVTESYQLTEELCKARSKCDLLEWLINETFEEFGAVDRDGNVIYLSEKSALNLGIDPQDAVGKHISDLTKSCLLAKVARTGVPQVSKIPRSNKRPVPVMVVPLYREGRLEGAVCKSIFTDVEEARQFVAKLAGPSVKSDASRSRDGPISRGVSGIADIVGNTPMMVRIRQQALRAAQSDSTILLTGETGTGKEILAHAIHKESGRRNGPFVKVNCAAIPESLLEAELFGYDEGSFTGARKGGKPGKLELAHGGTLFLDEVGDMSMSMQAKLLRVLQDHEVERLGSIKTFRVDIRVIAATNKDLKKLVRKGHFREDLFYRLAVVEINIPPLRHRLDDIRPLVEHFIPRLNQRTGAAVVEVDATVLEAFETYHWPGNVRQLINVLEAAMHFAAGSVIEYKDLPPSFRKELELHRQRRPVPLESSVALGPVQDIEKELIKRALTKSGGNKRRAALELGIARSTLYSKLRRYGLR